MNNVSNRKTYTALDIGKFLCALLILFYHYFSEHGPLPWVFEEALSLYAVAVALFMVISGFLTYRKLDTIAEYSDRKKYIFKQVKRIFTVYLPFIFFGVSFGSTVYKNFLLWNHLRVNCSDIPSPP